MPKSLEELDREFLTRVQTSPPAQAATPVSSHVLDELDRQFLARRNKKAEKIHTELPEEARSLAMPPTLTEFHTMRRRRVASVCSSILFYLAIAALLLAAWLFVRGGGTMGRDTHFYNVLTTSMQSVYPKGSLVFVRKVDPEMLVVGNDITFYIDANTTVTHRIVSILEDYQGTGERAFETKGVDNPTSDHDLVRQNMILGKVVFFIPGIGAFLTVFHSRLWIIVLFYCSAMAFSFFLKLALGETWQERKERRARKVLERAAERRKTVEK